MWTTGCQSCRRERVGQPAQAKPDARATSALDRAQGRSRGCGKAATGSGSFEPHTLEIQDSERRYHVRVPATYDGARAYPLVFRWHGTGGTGLSHGLDIESAAHDEAIVAAPDGRDGSFTWASGPEDLSLFDAAYAAITDAYCVDLGRVFAYGFSAGGGVTNALGCIRADKLRGVAVIAGFDVALPCDSPVAAWFLYDHDDDRVSIKQGEAARDRVLARNGCSDRTEPLGDGCLRYQGCLTGFPVVWCATRGHGHDIAGDTAPARVWSFFSQLP
jgi:polyhydroxybutyrate depolymerase